MWRLRIDEKNGELIPKVVRTRDDDEASPTRAQPQPPSQPQPQTQLHNQGPLPVTTVDEPSAVVGIPGNRLASIIAGITPTD